VMRCGEISSLFFVTRETLVVTNVGGDENQKQ
jgi:hypothetical protein